MMPTSILLFSRKHHPRTLRRQPQRTLCPLFEHPLAVPARTASTHSDRALVPTDPKFVCGIVTAACIGRLTWLSIASPSPTETDTPQSKRLAVGLVAGGIVIITNQIGIALTGMEHSLQVMLTTLSFYALVLELRTGRLPRWIWPVLVLAPLVRYECLAVTLPALTLLLFRGRWKGAVFTGLMTTALLVGFSLFLRSIGQPLMPASIMAKSSTVSSGGSIGSLANSVITNLSTPMGAVFTVGLIFLIAAALTPGRDRSERGLALAGAATVGMHLTVGRFGWYERYEVYAWLLLLLMLAYLYRPVLRSLVNTWSPQRIAALLIVATCIIGLRQVRTQAMTHFAIGNIALQQHQMHRFVTEHWQKPVAVNDLGWVSYQNDNYVLDLWGLASIQALQARKAGDPNWVSKTTANHNVQLAMVYTS